MRIKDSFKTAVTSLNHARSRSILTMLGIVIGIASVIVLMSIGNSAQALIIGQVESVGSNLIFVLPGGSNGSKFSSPAASQGIIIKTLTQTDVNAFLREPSIARATGVARGSAAAVYGDNNKNVSYEGGSADIFPIGNLNVAQGHAFTKADVDGYNHVAVLGSKLAATLFGQHNPVGKLMRLGNISVQIVGVLGNAGTGAFGVDQDNLVIIPITVAQAQMLGINYLNTVEIQADSQYDIAFVKSRLVSILRQNHSITDPNKDDFTIQTQADIASLLGNITSILTLFLAAIASISLVVGGIGIMNIMLVSVVERTREIGLRKAVGATEGDILQQFLFESVLLTFIGGLVGIAFGALLTAGVWLGVTRLSTLAWTFQLPLSSILIAVAVSTISGLVFGIYPARQAAKKSPIDSLRYE